MDVVFNRGLPRSCDPSGDFGNKASRLRPPNEFINMKISKLLITAVVSGGLMFAAAVQAHEEKEETVEMKSLPAAVQKTLKDKSAGGEITRGKKETKHGKVTYEAAVKKSGTEWGIELNQKGNIHNK